MTAPNPLPFSCVSLWYCIIVKPAEAYKQYTVSVEGQTSVGYGEKMTEYIYTKDKGNWSITCLCKNLIHNTN